jgi:8-oxo-dGTP pyrophosphatase MutT (NUDIX family)
MDPNETPETCAIRELKEETGYIGELVADKTFQVTPVMFNGKWPLIIALASGFESRPFIITASFSSYSLVTTPASCDA